MKITVLRQKFSKGLNIVEKITGKNLTLPILENVLIETEDNAVKLSTTDLEVGINYWILAKIEDKGKLTIPVKTLSSFISLVDEEQIDLETKDKTLNLKGKAHKTQIKGIDPKDFPIIPDISKDVYIEVEAGEFCQAILQVIDFCALTQTRLELSGVYLNFDKNEVRIVSTDSFRLSEKRIPITSSESFTPQSFILPRNAAREIVNIFSSEAGKMKLYISPNQVMAENNLPDSDHPRARLTTRLIEGQYPNYKEVIPKEFKTQITVSKDKFFNQIKTASLFSGKTNEIRFKIEKGEITVFSQNVDLGETKSHIGAEIKGEDVEVCFNYRFLSEGVNQIKSSDLLIEFNGTDGPGVIKSNTDASYLYVIMPIKPS